MQALSWTTISHALVMPDVVAVEMNKRSTTNGLQYLLDLDTQGKSAVVNAVTVEESSR